MTLGITSNIELMKECERLKIPLNLIDSKDNFKNIKPKNGAYIFNLQDNDKGNGTHWTCAFVINNVFLYFDSYAGVPPIDIIKFARKKCKTIKYNLSVIQHLSTDSCGYYCLLFLYFVNKHKNKCKCVNNLITHFTSLFNKNDTKYNQYLLENYYYSL